MGAGRGAPDRLGQHVDENLAQGARLAENFNTLRKRQVELDVTRGRLAFNERPGIGDGVIQRAGGGCLRGPGVSEESGEGERVLGRFQKIAGAVADVARILLVALAAERAEHLKHHHLGEADDGVEGRAQLMIDPRHEVGPIVVRGRMAPGARRLGDMNRLRSRIEGDFRGGEDCGGVGPIGGRSFVTRRRDGASEVGSSAKYGKRGASH